MIVNVDGHVAHGSTGGVELAGDDPAVVLIHGAGMDGTIWQLQTRYLAYRGHRAVAVDLPGHGQSEGKPLTTISEMAEWVVRFADAAGFATFNAVGHSMGTFIGLELAANEPDRIDSLTLLGTATKMPVHPDLLDAAQNDLPRAAALMAAWGLGRPAHAGVNPTPGMWMSGGSQALVENSDAGVLVADFDACRNYEGALDAAGATTCPTTVVIGSDDRMTPPAQGHKVADAIKNGSKVELSSIGHSMMIEDPRSVKKAIIETIAGA